MYPVLSKYVFHMSFIQTQNSISALKEASKNVATLALTTIFFKKYSTLTKIVKRTTKVI
jgi:hypothetical protein